MIKPTRKALKTLTPEEMETHLLKEKISNHATRSEKTAWERQFAKLQVLVNKLEPIEDKMLELIVQKTAIFDELMVLRNTLAETCVHPYEQLVEHDEYVVCKFCEKKLVTNEETAETKISE